MLKITILSLFLGTTSSHVLYSAQQPSDADAYEYARICASNAAFSSIGFYTGTILTDRLSEIINLTSFNAKTFTESDKATKIAKRNRVIKPSVSILCTMTVNIICFETMRRFSNALLGTTKQTDSALMYGFIAGASKAVYSRLTAPAHEIDICPICREEEAPVNPSPDDIINTNPNDDMKGQIQGAIFPL